MYILYPPRSAVQGGGGQFLPKSCGMLFGRHTGRLRQGVLLWCIMTMPTVSFIFLCAMDVILMILYYSDQLITNLVILVSKKAKNFTFELWQILKAGFFLAVTCDWTLGRNSTVIMTAKSNPQNFSTIKSSNLCTEIIEYSFSNQTAVRILTPLSYLLFNYV